MITALMGLKGLPWALIGLVAAIFLQGWFAYAMHQKGYRAGEAAVEAIHMRAELVAFAKSANINDHLFEADLGFVTNHLLLKDKIAHGIAEIPVPVLDCVNSDGLLHFFNEGVRGTHSNAYSWPVDSSAVSLEGSGE